MGRRDRGRTRTYGCAPVTDIAEFLRGKHAALIAQGKLAMASGLDEAADEIERLREEVRQASGRADT